MFPVAAPSVPLTSAGSHSHGPSSPEAAAPMANRLADESSPYLQQHAENPVDWYPWGPEALDLAKSTDRPILLSIGYSACHWCHVMERESFEDPATAAVMNEVFVSIKVDREERPDIDQIYMKAVQAMTGSGGWPLTAFLTPQGVPYYGGTYFPPVPRHGMPSFTQVLRGAGAAYRDRPEDVRTAGEQLLAALRKTAATSTTGAGTEVEALAQAYRSLSNQYDAVHGGFGRAPKFPQPVTLELLLRHHSRTGELAALEMAVHTLRQMAAGGMRDHLGGGFHRYSVDARWLVPHFEKMLYDNALLARAYIDAYRATGSDDLREIAEQTLEYIATDLRSPEGGFYSARDADSEGEEGTFYVWTPSEIESALSPEIVSSFMRLYDVTAGGNFEGRSILHLADGDDATELEHNIGEARQTLLTVRSQREPPLRDEKVITSWSAMTVRAFAEAGAALGRDDFIQIAAEGADFLWTSLRPGQALKRTWKDGRAKIPAFLEDYAALGNALLSVHAATLQLHWLHAARTLTDELVARFYDADTGIFYDTPADGESLIVRPRDAMDNATPSGTSLAAELLLRAAAVFGSAEYRGLAERIFGNEAEALKRFPQAFGRMLSALDRSLAPPVEIAILGDPSLRETRALIKAAHGEFGRAVTIVGGGDPDTGLPLLKGRAALGGVPTAFVCREYLCRLPVTDAAGLAQQVRALDQDG